VPQQLWDYEQGVVARLFGFETSKIGERLPLIITIGNKSEVIPLVYQIVSNGNYI
jgi:hypothetical protein